MVIFSNIWDREKTIFIILIVIFYKHIVITCYKLHSYPLGYKLDTNFHAIFLNHASSQIGFAKMSEITIFLNISMQINSIEWW